MGAWLERHVHRCVFKERAILYALQGMDFGVRSSISRVEALADDLSLMNDNGPDKGIWHYRASTERGDLKGSFHEKWIYLHK